MSDAPASHPITRDQLEANYGGAGFAERMERVDRYGTSIIGGCSAEALLAGNRAGPNETEWSLEQFRQWVRGGDPGMGS